MGSKYYDELRKLQLLTTEHFSIWTNECEMNGESNMVDLFIRIAFSY